MSHSGPRQASSRPAAGHDRQATHRGVPCCVQRAPRTCRPARPRACICACCCMLGRGWCCWDARVGRREEKFGEGVSRVRTWALTCQLGSPVLLLPIAAAPAASTTAPQGRAQAAQRLRGGRTHTPSPAPPARPTAAPARAPPVLAHSQPTQVGGSGGGGVLPRVRLPRARALHAPCTCPRVSPLPPRPACTASSSPLARSGCAAAQHQHGARCAASQHQHQSAWWWPVGGQWARFWPRAHAVRRGRRAPHPRAFG